MTTWILLRGLTRERRHWGGFPGLLAAGFPGCAVLELELPGNGELNALASPTSIARMAAYCRAAAAATGVPPPYLLLGESMGAMVAAAWAERHREEIAGCVLVNTSFGRFSPLLQRLRPRAWPVFLHILLDRTVEGRERRVLELTSGSPQAHPRAVAEWSAIRRSRPVSKGNAVRQLLAAARFRPPLAAPVPTLVLAGARDGLVDPHCSMAIARRWGCALAIHPEAGHDLPLDDGDWVVGEIRRWLETPVPAGP
jgi:pimeloyl-ACP methyl ester carboxylesterase